MILVLIYQWVKEIEVTYVVIEAKYCKHSCHKNSLTKVFLRCSSVSGPLLQALQQ